MGSGKPSRGLAVVGVGVSDRAVMLVPLAALVLAVLDRGVPMIPVAPVVPGVCMAILVGGLLLPCVVRRAVSSLGPCTADALCRFTRPVSLPSLGSPTLLRPRSPVIGRFPYIE